ncbi:MAG: hypothetical protein CME58_12765 [Halieaceae bacterium]|nr:hypothetical protein [Halieaceae bacterium]|tara:strand:- start:3305 stop:3580 length:276 start_codon:yes stop_codon:yes gene_type:complete
MNDIVEFLEELKSKPEWHRQIAWSTFKGMYRLTDLQKEIIRDELARRHSEASEELSAEYPTTAMWFKKGAVKQGVLDRELYNQLVLLHEIK